MPSIALKIRACTLIIVSGFKTTQRTISDLEGVGTQISNRNSHPNLTIPNSALLRNAELGAGGAVRSPANAGSASAAVFAGVGPYHAWQPGAELGRRWLQQHRPGEAARAPSAEAGDWLKDNQAQSRKLIASCYY